MKRLLFVLIVLFSFSTAFAQLKAPKTTVRDTVLVFKVSYDKYEVADDDAPCTFFEESATAFYIAGEKYFKGKDSSHNSYTDADGAEVTVDAYVHASVNGKASQVTKMSYNKAFIVLMVDKYEFTGINLRMLRDAVIKTNIFPEEVIPVYNKMLTLAALNGMKHIPEDAFTEEEKALVENLDLDPQQFLNPQESQDVVEASVSSSVSLKGRSIVGVLPRPSYSVQKEGTVVVDIWVDQDGSVVRAVPGSTGTTINDKELWNAARQAALKAKFNTDWEAKEQQQGTITYVFKFTSASASEEQEAGPFQLVEKQPSFKGGGPNAFAKWVNQRLVYPEKCKENGVQGMVIVQFTIEEDGRLTEAKVLDGVDPLLDAEAIRVVSMSPKWKPGTYRNKPVKVAYSFPVIFQLR